MKNDQSQNATNVPSGLLLHLYLKRLTVTKFNIKNEIFERHYNETYRI